MAIETLLAHDEAFSALIGAAIDGVIIIDEQGIIQAFNPAAERIFGYAAQELLGRSVEVLMPSPHRERHAVHVRRYVAGGPPHVVGTGREVEGLTKDGRVFPMHLALSELSIAGQRMFAGYVRDLTEQRRLEEQLRHAEKMEAIGVLTSGIAHDFGNLLMGITGCISIARGKLDPDHPSASYLNELAEAAKRGTGLTRQLMAFSRKHAPTLSLLDLDALIASSAPLLRRLASDDIEVRVPPGRCRSAVVADPGLIEQVLVNLVANACDAMPQGGHVEIETDEVELDPRAVVIHGVPIPGRYVTLSIRDTGHGMDDATRRRIFEPFFTTRALGKRTGLGLSTVYGIVEQLRGSIGVQSEPGRGTTFTLLLPCSSAMLPLPPREDANELPKGHETVLLVDDDRLVRLSVRHYLENLGYGVMEAFDPEDALRMSKMRAAPFDLLLTDVMMPGIDGPSLAKQVRALHPSIPVLFMSAVPQEELVARQSLVVGDEVLGKPFDQEQLALALRRILGATSRVAAEPATILLVEDDGTARLVVREFLEEMGFRVIAAARVGEAMTSIADGRHVDLLLTDVSLPDGRGDCLAQRLRVTRPSLPVVYMSGFDGGDLARHPDDAFIAKPFEFEDLMDVITVQLDRIHASRE